MGWAIKYNPNGVIPNQVTDYLQNIDEPLFIGRENTLVNCNLSQVGSEQDFTKWKVSDGTVVLMSPSDLIRKSQVEYMNENNLRSSATYDSAGFVIDGPQKKIVSGISKAVSLKYLIVGKKTEAGIVAVQFGSSKQFYDGEMKFEVDKAGTLWLKRVKGSGKATIDIEITYF